MNAHENITGIGGLSEQLRRAASYLEDTTQKRHPEIRRTPWYLAVIREAPDEIERLSALVQNGRSALDTNRRLAAKLKQVTKERDFARAERDAVLKRVIELEQLLKGGEG